ncbi:MAG: PCMD domain-containing protein [Bacteroidales bacterium]|nr:PCMD domain-containing protein [Bacteroidales bacterium]
MRLTIRIFTIITVCIYSAISYAQDNEKIVRQINQYGTFDHWCVREIKESGLIGGKTKYLYEFYGNPTDTIRYESKKAKAFKAPHGYLWRSNNVYACVAGIEKCSVTDFPEKRGNGYCCRIEVRFEEVKVAGMINMEVVTQGAFLLGNLPEPIKDTKDPMSKPLYGIPFTGRPQALQFDYKAKVGCEVIKATGFNKAKKMGYPDYPEVAIILQKRWEDENGCVHALRVGTGIERIMENVSDWKNGHKIEVHYGDISKEPYYKDYMKLMKGTPMDLHCINSKGKNVKIAEEGWADADETPNTLIIKFIASYGEAFNGGIGNTLWIDNVKLIM